MTRRTAAALHPVAVLSRWTGFCLPCGDEARPLVLTWTGLRGVRAWLAGSSFTDGQLRLTCVCCGGVDVVGWEDEPALPETALPDTLPLGQEQVQEPVEVAVEQPVLLPAGPVVASPPVREVHAELQALLGGRVDVPVTWHQPEPLVVPVPRAEAAVEPAQVQPVQVEAVQVEVQVEPVQVEPVQVEPAHVGPEQVQAVQPEPPAAPAPSVVRVVQVLDLDAPGASALRAVAEVPPPRQPSRAERRAAERAARRTPAPRGASDADALDLLDLVG